MSTMSSGENSETQINLEDTYSGNLFILSIYIDLKNEMNLTKYQLLCFYMSIICHINN